MSFFNLNDFQRSLNNETLNQVISRYCHLIKDRELKMIKGVSSCIYEIYINISIAESFDGSLVNVRVVHPISYSNTASYHVS